MPSQYYGPDNPDDPPALTVAQVIELLQAIPDQTLLVRVDGCDCEDDAGGVIVEGDTVYILRSDNMWLYKGVELKTSEGN